MTIPTSYAWLVNEWRATISGTARLQRQMLRVHRLEVD
jgi:hypothetical protein